MYVLRPDIDGERRPIADDTTRAITPARRAARNLHDLVLAGRMLAMGWGGRQYARYSDAPGCGLVFGDVRAGDLGTHGAPLPGGAVRRARHAVPFWHIALAPFRQDVSRPFGNVATTSTLFVVNTPSTGCAPTSPTTRRVGSRIRSTQITLTLPRPSQRPGIRGVPSPHLRAWRR